MHHLDVVCLSAVSKQCMLHTVQPSATGIVQAVQAAQCPLLSNTGGSQLCRLRLRWLCWRLLETVNVSLSRSPPLSTALCCAPAGEDGAQGPGATESGAGRAPCSCGQAAAESPGHLLLCAGSSCTEGVPGSNICCKYTPAVVRCQQLHSRRGPCCDVKLQLLYNRPFSAASQRMRMRMRSITHSVH